MDIRSCARYDDIWSTPETFIFYRKALTLETKYDVFHVGTIMNDIPGCLFLRRSLIILGANLFNVSWVFYYIYLSFGEGKDNEDGKHVDEDNQTDIPKWTRRVIVSTIWDRSAGQNLRSRDQVPYIPTHLRVFVSKDRKVCLDCNEEITFELYSFSFYFFNSTRRPKCTKYKHSCQIIDTVSGLKKMTM